MKHIFAVLILLAVLIFSPPRAEAQLTEGQGDYIDIIKPLHKSAEIENLSPLEEDIETEPEKSISYTFNGWTPEEFKLLGVIRFNGYKFTYYSEKVLPGGGLKIPGRHSDEYFVRDAKENICVASSDLKWGTYVETPFGRGRVYDSGCASGTVDIYVSGLWGKYRE